MVRLATDINVKALGKKTKNRSPRLASRNRNSGNITILGKGKLKVLKVPYTPEQAKKFCH